MVTVPINLTGGFYKHKSLALSAQICRNFWPRLIQDHSAKSPYVLDSFPGLKLFATIAGNADRGMLEHQETLYKVSETKLYSVASDGVETELGTIPGAGRCILEGIGSNVVIVTGGVAYEWDGATVTTGTDGDFETPNSAAHLNNQMLYDGDGGRFVSSDVGVALTINGLNYATAESNADDLLRVYVFAQIAYMLGRKSTEPWRNTGFGKPPFRRIEGGIIPVGLGAIYSVANDDEFMYMLGDDNSVYAISGTTEQVISTDVINREISRYSTIDDAIGWCMNLEGTWMYCLTFPVEGVTWIYPKRGEWFEWSFGSAGKRTISNSYAYAHRKHLVGDYTSGNIYELDFDTFEDTENNEPIIRIRDTGPLHGGLFKRPGKKIRMNRFELIVETGVGLLSGQGQDPVIMLSFSDDNGNTFGTESWGRIGKLGEFLWKVEWFVLGTFDSRIIRIKTSDPVYYSIHSAAADLEFLL